MKLPFRTSTRWAFSAAILGAGLLAPGLAGAADGTAYVLADVQCDANHNGVLDLTLVNDQQLQSAVFVVAESAAVAPAVISVAAASVSAISFTDLADGQLTVPVLVDGVDAAVAVRVACDAPEVAVLGAPVRRQAAASELPRTGRSAAGGLLIGSALVGAGVAASLVSRRRYS